MPTVFTQGTSDPFGTIEEVHAAADLIPAPTDVVEITGARHDLGSKTIDVPVLAVDAGATVAHGVTACATARTPCVEGQRRTPPRHRFTS